MTKEEAINHIRYGIIEGNYHLPKELGIEACEMAIKALEQESVLDKIRADIETMGGDIETIVDALAIIDKHRESEEDT